MGQQQLLLLVLGIVIVGLAVVVGIGAFSENRVKSNADAMVADGLRIASDIQAYALKPAQVGGGLRKGSEYDGLYYFMQEDDPLAAIGYKTEEGVYSNVNATWIVIEGSTCSAAPREGSFEVNSLTPVALVGQNEDTKNEVCIVIAGTGSNNIGTGIVYEGFPEIPIPV